MDPNATLSELRRLAETILANVEHETVPELAGEMAEAFVALDDWLCAHGFKPKSWEA